MKKSVAGQFIGAQMTTIANGEPFTGAVTVAVTGDAGTQATGSVGSGACVHEGNGFHTYAPAQAETNYDHVAFTFTGTGAVAATVQVYTSFPQSADHVALIAAVQAVADAIAADTQALTAREALSAASLLVPWTTALTESYAADGAAFTPAQALYEIVQFLHERATSGTALTVKRLDGATTAYTLTLDNATIPTAITRTT